MSATTQILWLLGAIGVAGLGFVGGPAGAGAGVGAVGLVLLILGLRQQIFAAGPMPMVRAIRERPASAAPLADTRSLKGLIIAAIAIRIVGAVVFNLTGFNVAVAPDSLGYAILGEQLTLYWQSPHLEAGAFRAGINPMSFYQNLNAVTYFLLGPHTGLALSILNAFVGTIAALVFSRLAGSLYGGTAVRPAFVLCAFWPSIILWTSINLRDSWSFLLLGLTLLAAQRLKEEFSVRHLLLLGACVAAYPFIRTYMLLLVSVGIAASYLVVRARQIPVALLVIGGLVLALGTLEGRFAVLGDFSVESKLDALQKFRTGLAYGSSAFEQTGVDLSTPGGALIYLPRGLANFLLAPFPWRLESWRQLLAMPETLAWYGVLAAALIHGWRSARSDFKTSALLIFVTASIVVAYALVEGNEGTAYRHRAHVLLLAFVFAAGYWAERRRRSPHRTSHPVGGTHHGRSNTGRTGWHSLRTL